MSVFVVFIVVFGGLVLLSVELFSAVIFCVLLYTCCVVNSNSLFLLNYMQCSLSPSLFLGP